MKAPTTTKKTINLFIHHAFRYKRFILPLLVIMPLTILTSDFLIPYIMSDVLQRISQGQFDVNNLWASFGGHIMLYAAAVVVSGVVGWRLNIWLIWHLELRVKRDMATRVFNHLMKMSANFHNNRFAGSLVSQSNKLTGAYIRFADSTIFDLIPLVVALVATMVILTPRVPLYSLILAILTMFYVIGAIYFAKPVRDANRKEAEADSKQTGELADALTNVIAVKSFAGNEYEQERYWKAASNTRLAGIGSIRATTTRETYASMVTSSIHIAAILIAVFGVSMFHADIATLFLIVSYTGAIGFRLWEFQNMLRQYNRALGDASDMVKILEMEPGVKDPVRPEKSHIHDGAIAFDDMTFAHPEANETLFKHLNLKINAGEKIGLVGHSGSGKTTLTKLLLRYSDIDDGSITIDGQDIRAITQDDLRRAIAYVPQEPLLFHRSIRENIAYSNPGASLDEVRDAAKKAHAAEFIQQLPEGYDTLVGERGVKLSGGQRQRIAIARAILKNAPILLLDEATSALDSESEIHIQAALWELMKGRTAIVIAHRLSTIQKMDRIVVLENGKVIEQGSHSELIAQKGTYADLWAHQSGGFIEE
jgi:ATP-binding cassette, subfamily B, bacterial